MDLALSGEQLAFKKVARDFLDAEVVPHRAEWDRRAVVASSRLPVGAPILFASLVLSGTSVTATG